MNIDYTKDVKVLGKVVSLALDNVVAEAEQVFDTGFQYKTYGQAKGGLDQHTINSLFKDTLIGLTNAGFTPNNNNNLNLEVDNLHVLQNATVDGVLVVNGLNVKSQIDWLTNKVNDLINSVGILEACCGQVNEYINSSNGGQSAFTVDPISMLLTVGGSTGTAVAKIGGVATNAVSWSTDNSSVATVSQLGVVTPQGLGLTYIVATHNESHLTARCYVVVSEPQTSWELLILGDSNRTILKNTSSTVQAVILEVGDPSHTNIETITWSSSNPSIASVTGNGMTATITGVNTAAGQSTGEAVITARSASGLTASIGVSVYTQTEEPSTITVNGYPTMYVGGQPQTLEAVATPLVASNSVTWSSSDTTKATVTTTGGVVSALAKGNVTITATSTVKPSVSGSITIEIIDPADIAVSSIVVNPMRINQGESLDIKQYTTMTQANGQRNVDYLNWSYSINNNHSSYISVDSYGWVSGVAVTSGLPNGYAEIVVKYNDGINNEVSAIGHVEVVSSGGDTPSTPAPNVSESLTLTVLNQGDIHVGDIVEVQVTSTPGIQSVYNTISNQYIGSNAGTPWYRLWMKGNQSGILTWTGYTDQYHNSPNFTSTDIYQTTTSGQSTTPYIADCHNIVNYPLSNADLNVPNSIIVKFVANAVGTITLTGKTTYTEYNLEGASNTCTVNVIAANTAPTGVNIMLNEYQTLEYTPMTSLDLASPVTLSPSKNVTSSDLDQVQVYVQSDISTGLNCEQLSLRQQDGSIVVPLGGYIKLSSSVLPSATNQSVTWTITDDRDANISEYPLPTAQFPIDANGVITIPGNQYNQSGYPGRDEIRLHCTSDEDPTKTTSVRIVWVISGNQQSSGETRSVYVINDSNSAMVSSATNGSTYTIAANAASLPEASNGTLYADGTTEPANLVNKQIDGGWNEPVQASFTITVPTGTLTAVLYERTNNSSQHYQQVASQITLNNNIYTLTANLSNSGPYVLYVNTTNA